MTSPNQIVALHFDEINETLKVSKGIETRAKCLSATHFGDNIVAAYDDKTIKIFKSDGLEKESEYEFETCVRSIAAMDQQTLLAGG